MSLRFLALCSSASNLGPSFVLKNVGELRYIILRRNKGGRDPVQHTPHQTTPNYKAYTRACEKLNRRPEELNP